MALYGAVALLGLMAAVGSLVAGDSPVYQALVAAMAVTAVGATTQRWWQIRRERSQPATRRA